MWSPVRRSVPRLRGTDAGNRKDIFAPLFYLENTKGRQTKRGRMVLDKEEFEREEVDRIVKGVRLVKLSSPRYSRPPEVIVLRTGREE